MPAPLPTAGSSETVVWRLADPSRELDRVRLWSNFDLGDTRVARVVDGWEPRRAGGALPPCWCGGRSTA